MPKFKYPRAQLDIECCLRRARAIGDPDTPWEDRQALWSERKAMPPKERQLIEELALMYVTVNTFPPYPKDRHIPRNIHMARALIEVHILQHK